ncbi:hypothetical protein GCM10011492_35310 [Flexivirga endophytica]|uniref:DUF3806 domain-containing protein n=1 Tax=Flexivirga endophytica TaxID=1849103 RepID=A0A916TDZ9_9MICO|nr:DUF3806 domain-containing protein [Flexivirga endophytica]GGB41333.1 hypothetical protein GCM10011492_35310 [Flexivirga endophytica]GHB49174.1 hypothetical protein GCM10008112_17690 [Flexivirga endophytica]
MTAEIVVQPLDRKAQRALTGWLGDAQAAGIDVDDLESIGTAYDAYVHEVLLTPAADRVDPTPTLTMIAMAMGEYLQRNSGLQWRVVEDGEGADLALSSADDLGVLYPIDPIAQAWEQRQRGWLPVFARELLKNIEGTDA